MGHYPELAGPMASERTRINLCQRKRNHNMLLKSQLVRPEVPALQAMLSLLVCGLLCFPDGLVNQSNLVTVSPDSQQVPVLVP
jgi:hypothetical protein